MSEVLREYKVPVDKIGHFVCDNASSNDSAVHILLKALNPAITKAQIAARRLRCFDHVVNLAAQSLLAATESESQVAAAEAAEQSADGLQSVLSAGKSFINHGPLGKLHRIIKYVLASPQRREEFGGIKGGKRVKEYDYLGVSRPYRYYRIGLSKLRAKAC